MLQEFKFAGQNRSFEAIYTDVDNNGYGQLLSHIVVRIGELSQDMQLVPEGSEQYEAYAGLIEKYQTCFELMPLIIQEATYRYIAHRASPEEIEALIEQAQLEGME